MDAKQLFARSEPLAGLHVRFQGLTAIYFSELTVLYFEDFTVTQFQEIVRDLLQELAGNKFRTDDDGAPWIEALINWSDLV